MDVVAVTESPFTEYGQKMIVDMPRAQRLEDFKRKFGYPVGVDFMTMKPIYWAPAHKVSKIKTFSGKKYTDLNDPELYDDYQLRQIAGSIKNNVWRS